MEEFVARRTKMAETKIAPGRGAGAGRCARRRRRRRGRAPPRRSSRDTAKGKVADDLIAQGIADVKAKLN